MMAHWRWKLHFLLCLHSTLRPFCSKHAKKFIKSEVMSSTNLYCRILLRVSWKRYIAWCTHLILFLFLYVNLTVVVSILKLSVWGVVSFVELILLFLSFTAFPNVDSWDTWFLTFFTSLLFHLLGLWAPQCLVDVAEEVVELGLKINVSFMHIKRSG